MIGRVDERTHIEGLLVDARSGRSGALVLFGDPGVGKSMLLSHAVDLSDGFVVLRATGVESEVDLAFAAPTIREYQQVVAHYAPSAGYFPLS